MRAAFYLRVSTGEQTVENQRLELSKVIALRGWTLVKEYTDEGISGAKARDQRPGLNELCNGAIRREFDVVVAWSVDRLGRSLVDLIALMNDLHAAGVQLYVHQQAFDTTTPSGRLMFQVAGAFAEFEREIIKSRIKIGMDRAKASGKKFGRELLLTPVMIRLIIERRAEGMSAAAIGRSLGISERTVWRGLRAGGVSFDYLD